MIYNMMFCFILLCSPFYSLQATINWMSPTTLSSTNTNASDPQVVIDTLGNVTATWVESGLLKASVYTASTGKWSTATTLSSAATTSSQVLGIDSSGNVTALWIQNGVAYSSLLTFGGSWNKPIALSSTGASSPALAVDASGNAAAIWVRNANIESSLRTVNKWNSVLILDATGSPSDSPQVAISSNGTAIAVWHSVISGVDAIISATTNFSETKDNNCSWNTLTVVTGNSLLSHAYPQVAIDPTGHAIVVWFQYIHVNQPYQDVTVFSSSLLYNTASWSTPYALSNPGQRNPADLTLNIAFDTGGNTIVFWTNSYDGQLFNLESSAMLSFGTWNAFVLPCNPNIYSLATDLAIHPLGGILVVYMTGNSSNNILSIESAESDIGSPVLGAWTIPCPISQAISSGYPQCALSLNGNVSNAAAVWISFNGTSNVIQASVGSKTNVLPPSQVNIVQSLLNFGVYNDYFNTISWTPSSSPNILKYNIYRNGILFASTPDANTFQVVDHNAIPAQSGSVTYGVAAMNINYSQSAITTVSFP